MYEVLGSNEGVLESRADDGGGVDPAVGVLDAGDFRVAAEPASTGSAECCLFNCHDVRNDWMLGSYFAGTTYLDFLNALGDLALPPDIFGR